MSREGVRVLHLFGRDYAIKTSAGEEHLLQQAMALLEGEIASNGRRYPHARGQELLLLSALNLCARQLQQQLPSDLDVRLGALNQRIRRHLDAPS